MDSEVARLVEKESVRTCNGKTESPKTYGVDTRPAQDLEYKAYLKSVSGRLEADDYQIERDVVLPRYKVDLYAFKDTEMAVVRNARTQIACFFTLVSEAAEDIVLDFCKSALAYEEERRGKIVNIISHRGVQPTRLLLPVVVSANIRDDGIAFVRSYDPFSWQLYQHPVLVDLETGEVYHRTGLKLYGAAYQRIIDGIVEERITPE